MMVKKWTYIAIFGIACMMTGVLGLDNSTTPLPSTNMTTNPHQMQTNNTTTNMNQTQPNSTTTNLNQTQLNYTTTNLNQTQSNYTTTNLNQTQSNYTTTNLNQTQPNMTTSPNQANIPLLVTRDNCKKDRACFSTPANCDPSNSNGCYFVSTRAVGNNTGNFIFELSGDSSGYIAVGLSTDSKEGDGDTVYSCANNNGEVELIRASLNNSILTQDNTVRLSFNASSLSHFAHKILAKDVKFKPTSLRGFLNNSRIQCIFVAAGLSNTTHAANTSAYLFYFTGNYTNRTLGSPVTRMKTNGPVDLSNPNSSDVSIITPTTTTSTPVTTFTTTNTTANPAIMTSNALQHTTSQAAVLILAGILAVLLL